MNKQEIQRRKELAEYLIDKIDNPPQIDLETIVRNKRIKELAGNEWQYKDETLDEYRNRIYGIPN